MPDDANLDGTDRFLFFCRLEEKYVHPRPSELIHLAGRISNARAFLNGELPVVEPDVAARFPELLSKLLAQRATQWEELKKEYDSACDAFFLHGDITFLQRLLDANALLKNGAPSRQLDAPGAAVLAFEALLVENHYPPTPRDVQEKVDTWFKEGGKKPISAKRWRQILAEMSPLFHWLPEIGPSATGDNGQEPWLQRIESKLRAK
jgi:hypothetical protein